MQYVTSVVASLLRKGKGNRAIVRDTQPEKLIELYDMEGCPYCRLVREYLTELNLDVLIHPCPRKSTRNRQKLAALGGKQQTPYLYDPNTDTGLYASRTIIDYLNEQYDPRRLPKKSSLLFVTSLAVSLMRTMSGILYRPSLLVGQPLELFSFEASPHSRLVRERLTEMEISYLLRNSACTASDPSNQPSTHFESTRQELLRRSGKLQIPYLYDPNIGKGFSNLEDIFQHLTDTYSTLQS